MPEIKAQDETILKLLKDELSFQIDVRFSLKLQDDLFSRDLLLAILRWPTDQRVYLAERLLTEPPTDAMRGKLPMVLFCDTEEDRLRIYQQLTAAGIKDIDAVGKDTSNGNEEQSRKV